MGWHWLSNLDLIAVVMKAASAAMIAGGGGESAKVDRLVQSALAELGDNAKCGRKLS